MATLQPVRCTLRGGEDVIVRAAVEADAEILHTLLRESFGASEHLVTMPDEWSDNPGETRQRILDNLAHPNELMLVAESDGILVGELTFHASRRRRMSHHGQFGLSVSPQWRGRGVGRALILTLLDWAAAHPTIEKVRLGVFDTNTRARALYTRLGFVEESRQLGFFKIGPGEYVDDILMAIYVKPGLAPSGFRTHLRGEAAKVNG